MTGKTPEVCSNKRKPKEEREDKEQREERRESEEIECLGHQSSVISYMTRSQYKGKYLSGRVPKNLTLCRIHEFFSSKIP